ncbi:MULTISPECIES: NAD(P)/FAD-dependent oxidoreductase [unclassified Caballeronia]|jgi:phytoene dehydrogenase-like protein|uniref:phytoene desaturase family protein n=1 Tax=unclassified Caballeronia TaxID=2646786 RepID=UPI0028620854|nr:MULTISPECIES: NAD(P)/FAD-dependent oxidoreductase [unclassified Caballeronia]MDR5774004.1 NAD(P)/FAD-dependent oxidoreductase [Caballeronia sp. LZ002]MDR5849439.1 NAD(P)/FAD-dependent oxidoreductase [Caballeronia sp. LZ003]
MANRYDAVIIGAGHNGLVCGAYLARKGFKVCLLERRELAGGAAVSEAVWPGYRVSTASYTMALLQPRIIRELELAKYGYEIVVPPPMLHLYGDGKSLVFRGEGERLHADIARFSRADADAYGKYRAHMARLGKVVAEMLWEIPPNPADAALGARGRLLGFAWRFRDMGEQFYDLYDVLTLSARDYLSRWFESDQMIAALGFYASCGGAATSICSPGSAYVLLRGFIRDHTTSEGPAGFVRGGMGSISEAIAASGRAHGMEVRCNAPVASVEISGGRATGVRLASGESIEAGCVISNVATKILFQQLVDAGYVPPEFLARVAQIRDRSTAFKVNLALRRLPTFTDFDSNAAGFAYPAQVRIGPSVEYLERAWDASKYGEISPRPPLVVLTPSAMDPSVAPAGKHLMSIFGQHAPYTLREGTWDTQRKRLFHIVLDTLALHAPDIRDCIDDAQVLSPADLERIFALPGGHVHHGELSADQIFFRRPVQGAADYRTPVKGLYQCGASVHPGGGVTGVPGHNAAQVVMRSERH